MYVYTPSHCLCPKKMWKKKVLKQLPHAFCLHSTVPPEHWQELQSDLNTSPSTYVLPSRVQLDTIGTGTMALTPRDTKK